MVYLSLGSNLGDSFKLLEESVKRLSVFFNNPKCSAVYRTKAMYDTKQNDFLNLCFSGESERSNAEVFQFIQDLEISLGRVRDPNRPNGPRLIDIDYLQRDNEILNESHLILPHPRIQERPFVLVPLIEIDPDLTHPQTGRSYASYLKELDPSGVYFLGRIA